MQGAVRIAADRDGRSNAVKGENRNGPGLEAGIFPAAAGPDTGHTAMAAALSGCDARGRASPTASTKPDASVGRFSWLVAACGRCAL